MELAFDTADRSGLVVHVVQTYKHVGSEASVNGSNRRELACRKGAAGGALRPLRVPVYGSPRFSKASRVELLASLVHSRLYYNVHIWCNFTESDYSGLHRAAMLGFRTIVDRGSDCSDDYRTPDSHVLARLCQIEPRYQIAASRLRYLPRLCQYGPDCLFAFLQHSAHARTSWLAQLADDVQWLRRSLTFQHDVPDISAQPAEFLAFVTAKPQRWYSLVKTAVRRHAKFHKQQASSQQLVKAFVDYGIGKGVFLPSSIPVAVCAVADPYLCYACDSTFSSSQGLGVHMFKAHGRKQLCRWYAAHDVCDSCLRKFHDRPRLLVHLAQSSPRCLEHLLHVHVPLQDGEVAVLDEVDRVQRRLDKRRGISLRQALLPAVQSSGPRLPPLPWDECRAGRLRVIVGRPADEYPLIQATLPRQVKGSIRDALTPLQGYAPELCKVLAQGFVQHVQSGLCIRLVSQRCELRTNLANFFRQLGLYAEAALVEQQVQYDFVAL
jgi:hypothetical protein